MALILVVVLLKNNARSHGLNGALWLAERLTCRSHYHKEVYNYRYDVSKITMIWPLLFILFITYMEYIYRNMEESLNALSIAEITVACSFKSNDKLLITKNLFQQVQGLYYIPLSVWLWLWILEFLETVAMSNASSIILEDIEWFLGVWPAVSSRIKNQKAQSSIIKSWKD